MEHQYLAQPMGQSAFFYYNPEQTCHQRNQGFYTPAPTSVPLQSADYFQFQPVAHPQMLYSQGMPTPSASPKPRFQRPAIVLQQEQAPYMLRLAASHTVPSTPTLSASGSFSSSHLDSPCNLMQTPADLDYFSQPFHGVKSACDDEQIFSDVLSADWTHHNSPPLTPGKFDTKMQMALIGESHEFVADRSRSVPASARGSSRKLIPPFHFRLLIHLAITFAYSTISHF